MAQRDAVKGELHESAIRLRGASFVLVLTGAGVSRESGVPTFRGPEGLWHDLRPEDLATPEAFARDPRLVWEFYEWRRQSLGPLRPNRAHEAIKTLEESSKNFLLATQNVDGLHGAAGSRLMVELHGSLWRVRCTALCGPAFEDRRAPLPELPPRCHCGALLRPDVVWFGETLPLDRLEKAMRAAEEAEVVLVVGTSSIVYPAAALPDIARRSGAFIIEVNPERTPLTPLAHVFFQGPAAQVVPALVEAA